MRGKRLPLGQLQRVLDRGRALRRLLGDQPDESALVRDLTAIPVTSRPRPRDTPISSGVRPEYVARGPLASQDRACCSATGGCTPSARSDRAPNGPAHGRGPRALRGASSRVRAGTRVLSAPRDADSISLATLGGPLPAQSRPSTYGVALGSRQEPIARGPGGMLRHGLPIEACNPETGPGQFEITLGYRAALEAADDAFLFKAEVKELALQQELVATFMAKPHPEWAGTSCHIHLSLAGDRRRPSSSTPRRSTAYRPGCATSSAGSRHDAGS